MNLPSKNWNYLCECNILDVSYIKNKENNNTPARAYAKYHHFPIPNANATILILDLNNYSIRLGLFQQVKRIPNQVTIQVHTN